LLWAPGAWLAVVGGLIWLGASTYLVGRLAFPDEREGVQMLFGVFGVLALIAAFGSLAYWLKGLDSLTLGATLVVIPWVVLAVSPILAKRRTDALPLVDEIKPSNPVDFASVSLFLLTVFSDGAALHGLMTAAGPGSIRSPWDAVSPLVLLWLALGTLGVVALAYRNRLHHLTLITVSLHLFTLISPALLTYAVGYGFDAFVHQATESLIAQVGVVMPKTPYYLGQYALVVTIAKLFRLPIVPVDRLLLPILVAVYVPLSSVYLLRRGFKLERHLAVLASTALFLLPLGSFVVTTPQGLGDLFALMTALLATTWSHDHRPSLAYPTLLALAALAIHPLAGIPAVMILAFSVLHKLKPWKHPVARAAKASVWLMLFAAAAVALPAVFVVSALRGGSGVAFNFASFGRSLTTAVAEAPSYLPWPETRYTPAVDFAHFVEVNRAFLLLVLAGFGFWLLARTQSYRRTAFATLGCAVGLLISATALYSGLKFEDVIAYEQANYSVRLFGTALLLLSPLLLAAVAWWWRRLRQTDAPVRLACVLIYAATIASLGYATFPRNDAYATSRAWSTSTYDLEAVQAIDSRAAGHDYLVLSDQAVSAAALRVLGFKKYYGDQYLYPIPTGGRLYQSYLSMVNDGPKRATVVKALESYGAEQGYFVVNDYWTDSAKIIEAAKKEADSSWTVGDGHVTIFEYDRLGKL
jgi:hypothetical protein